MDLRISKKNAEYLKKAVAFYLMGCHDRETNQLDKEKMKLIGVTMDGLKGLLSIYENIDKQLKIKK